MATCWGKEKMKRRKAWGQWAWSLKRREPSRRAKGMPKRPQVQRRIGIWILDFQPPSAIFSWGLWCSGITPAQHAGGPVFKSQCAIWNSGIYTRKERREGREALLHGTINWGRITSREAHEGKEQQPGSMVRGKGLHWKLREKRKAWGQQACYIHGTTNRRGACKILTSLGKPKAWPQRKEGSKAQRRMNFGLVTTIISHLSPRALV